MKFMIEDIDPGDYWLDNRCDGPAGNNIVMEIVIGLTVVMGVFAIIDAVCGFPGLHPRF